MVSARIATLRTTYLSLPLLYSTWVSARIATLRTAQGAFFAPARKLVSARIATLRTSSWKPSLSAVRGRVSARIATLRTNQPGLNTLIVTVRTNPQTEAALAKYAYLQALGVCRSPGRRAGLEVDAPLLHPPTQPDL